MDDDLQRWLDDGGAIAPDLVQDEPLGFAVRAGNNKFGLHCCPFCFDEGVKLPGNVGRFFVFRDWLSAKEYKISGLCQNCQDDTFGV